MKNKAIELGFLAKAKDDLGVPTIVCLCGSTRFMEAFQTANLEETLKGNIVLSVGCNTKSDVDLFKTKSTNQQETIKLKLDELHKRKIDLADEILVLNVGGYIGESTRSEILYAADNGKKVRWLSAENAVKLSAHLQEEFV